MKLHLETPVARESPTKTHASLLFILPAQARVVVVVFGQNQYYDRLLYISSYKVIIKEEQRQLQLQRQQLEPEFASREKCSVYGAIQMKTSYFCWDIQLRAQIFLNISICLLDISSKEVCKKVEALK